MRDKPMVNIRFLLNWRHPFTIAVALALIVVVLYLVFSPYRDCITEQYAEIDAQDWDASIVEDMKREVRENFRFLNKW